MNTGVNVIFISIDSLRADHLRSYGYSRNTSPNIDQLAGEGVLFSNAFSTSSWTLPTHLSMITSLYSQSHGVLTG
ncbi:MAG TPA: sulfatase-like hydrolase/transferase, partial [Anaerolineales bacterium]|nr:sulfatase-like hydrolase/transferase [Anaerolineales bacterium]